MKILITMWICLVAGLMPSKAVLASQSITVEASTSIKKTITTILDRFHQAASDADAETYFNFLSKMSLPNSSNLPPNGRPTNDLFLHK